MLGECLTENAAEVLPSKVLQSSPSVEAVWLICHVCRFWQYKRRVITKIKSTSVHACIFRCLFKIWVWFRNWVWNKNVLSLNIWCQLSELYWDESSIALTDHSNNYPRNWFYCISIPGLRYIFILSLCTINLECVRGESLRLLWMQWNSFMSPKIISFPLLKLW